MKPRFDFLRRRLAVVLMAAAVLGSSGLEGAPVWQITGTASQGLVSIDSVLRDFLQSRGIQRGALAITRNGRLVYDRAYTWAEPGTELTQPTNRFRIASLSKPLTAIGILRLVQNGRIALDQRVDTILNLTNVADARFRVVTVRHLLNHRGGWDRGISGDPMFNDAAVANALAGGLLPITKDMIFQYQKTRTLNFSPGTAYAYSNFGYFLLGLIIEKVSGQSYEDFMQELVFRPAGAFAPRLGRSLLTDRHPGEVDYRAVAEGITPSVFGPGTVPWPYGGFNHENLDANGGWIAAASDLVRVASAFDSLTNSPLLSRESINLLWGRPPQESPASAAFYACGWLVRPVTATTVNAWHDGSLPGTRTYLVRLANGITWAVLFNQREQPGQQDYGLAADIAINNAIFGIPANAWPTQDLFDADGDGLVDAWERHYFGGNGLLGPSSLSDRDGDGLTDVIEHYLLSDPWDAQSASGLAVALASPGQLRLQWPSAPGRIYSIQQAGSVGSGADWQDVGGGVRKLGNGMTLTFSPAPSPETIFYRLQVQPQRR